MIEKHPTAIMKRDKYGKTGFMWACYKNHLELVKLISLKCP